ncbi:MAG: hypothetical protein L3J42_01920 [Hydrogenimonas sp.]|nr:hypothetical protein [Hydrogenimonas sp.]
MGTLKSVDSLSAGLAEASSRMIYKTDLPAMWKVPNFAYTILESCMKDSQSGTNSAKALAKIAFLMLDDLQSDIRYIMKRGRKESASYLPETLRLLESYGLFLRRAIRKRTILEQMLRGIEQFYAENSIDELEEAIFFGTKALAHIDIMISLHEEELNFHYSSFAKSDELQGEKDEDR